MKDTEATSLAEAVAALGDDQGRHPSVEQIAEMRRAETRAKAIRLIEDAVARHDEDCIFVTAEAVVDALNAAGLQIVARRPI